MSAKVLFVDDEPNVLDGIKRQLRKRIEIETALSGEEGLELIARSDPFAIVVSDMRMPQMNGSQFLSRVREVSPDSVRMILSGQSDLENAIAAVNDGHIFRFLTKPCSPEQLWGALETGLEQYRLLTVEKELLDQTLSGAVQTMTELLGLANSAASNKATRIQHYAEEIGTALGIAELWQFRLGAMLSQIGCITLPQGTLEKIEAGKELSNDERQIFAAHPEVAGRLLANIPRMEEVAEMIRRQDRPVPSELSEDIREWPVTVLGATALRAAVEIDVLRVKGKSLAESVRTLCAASIFPVAVKEVLKTLVDRGENRTEKQVTVKELMTGMILDEDVITPSGLCLLTRGQEITATNLVRLRAAADGVGIVEPFGVIEVRTTVSEGMLASGDGS